MLLKEAKERLLQNGYILEYTQIHHRDSCGGWTERKYDASDLDADGTTEIFDGCGMARYRMKRNPDTGYYEPDGPRIMPRVHHDASADNWTPSVDTSNIKPRLPQYDLKSGIKLVKSKLKQTDIKFNLSSLTSTGDDYKPLQMRYAENVNDMTVEFNLYFSYDENNSRWYVNGQSKVRFKVPAMNKVSTWQILNTLPQHFIIARGVKIPKELRAPVQHLRSELKSVGLSF